MSQNLSSAFTLKSLRLRNRFVMAPMTRLFSPSGVPVEGMTEYYRRRAAGGVGLIVSEGIYLRHPASGARKNVPNFHSPGAAEAWKRTIEAVHGEGAAIVSQLWHEGAARGSSPQFNHETSSVSPSGINIDGQSVGKALSANDMRQIISDYASAAVTARELGFDGLELHGAHGYLLDEFMWTRTNMREDDYNGSASARALFPAQVVAAIREAVGDDFAIIYRFSQWKVDSYDARVADSPQELAELLTPLKLAGVDMFHASVRRYWEPAFEGLQGEGAGLSLAGWVRRLLEVPVITVGSVGLAATFQPERSGGGISSDVANIDRLVEQFADNEFDLVAIGRALLADPDWVRKVEAGRSEDLLPYRPEHRETLV